MRKIKSENKLGDPPPFLIKFAVERMEGETLPGAYDETECLWMVETPHGKVPIISQNGTLAEITTKTKVEQESDDTEIMRMTTQSRSNTMASLLQLTTKTHAQAESDDIDPRDFAI